MQTIILAGGKGSRLKPYTVVFPKPLMPIGDYPILEVVIRQLKRFGFDNITMAVGHLQQLLEAFFGDGSKWGISISYSSEEKPLGTAGPLHLIENFDDDFLVMNGDVLTNIDYGKFFETHKTSGAICTIATYKKPVKINLGVIKANEDGTIYDYIEKPTLDYSVSMGVYAFKKEVLQYIPKDQYFDFPDLIKTLIKNDKKVSSYLFDGYWLDIGRPEDYEKAADEFEKNKTEFLGNEQ